MNIVGAWKLVSIQWEDAASGALTDIYGPNPLGSLMFSDSGRVSAILMAADRGGAAGAGGLDEAALFRSMMAYAGRYRIEGEGKLVFNIDAAWHPDWIGAEHIRYIQPQGEAMAIRSAKTLHPKFGDAPGYAVMTWVRA